MKIFLLSLLLIFIFSPAKSQNDSIVTEENYDFGSFYHKSVRHKSWGPIAGIHIQKSAYAELGLARAIYGTNGHHPFFGAYSFSGELYLGKDFIFAPKLSVLVAGGSAMRLSLLYYSDLDKGSLRLRPEIGMGMGFLNFFYGYNIPLTNKKFPNVNEHNFSLVFFTSRKLVKEGFF